jgi:hypothetical protein
MLTWLQSGVSYGVHGRTNYDGNADHCLCINESYSVQMSQDNYWLPSGRSQEFHFQACSGTRWHQIDTELWQGHVQLNEIPSNIDMMVLQAGGNNAGFADVAYACISQPEYDYQWALNTLVQMENVRKLSIVPPSTSMARAWTSSSKTHVGL